VRLYIAGPLESSGDPEENLAAALACATELLEAGHAPYVPHLTLYWHRIHPQDRDTWIGLDLEWVDQCHGLVRLPGHSPGADIEVRHAMARLVDVYYWPDAREALCGEES